MTIGNVQRLQRLFNEIGTAYGMRWNHDSNGDGIPQVEEVEVSLLMEMKNGWNKLSAPMRTTLIAEAISQITEKIGHREEEMMRRLVLIKEKIVVFSNYQNAKKMGAISSEQFQIDCFSEIKKLLGDIQNQDKREQFCARVVLGYFIRQEILNPDSIEINYDKIGSSADQLFQKLLEAFHSEFGSPEEAIFSYALSLPHSVEKKLVNSKIFRD